MDPTTGTIGEAAEPAATKRRVRNYLIDTSLQLRLAAWLLAVASGLCGALGWMLWNAYQETSRIVALSSPEAGEALARLFESGDRTRIAVLGGALALVLLVLLVLAVVFTHRIAGPAYAIRRACQEIAAGALAPPRPLRSGDLLRELAEDFAAMVDALREREAREREEVLRAAAVLRADEPGAPAREEAAALLERLAAEKERRLAP